MALLNFRSAQKYIITVLVACLCLFAVAPVSENEPIAQQQEMAYWSSFTGVYHFVSVRSHVLIKFLDHKLQVASLPDIYRDVPAASTALPVMFLCIIQVLLILLLLVPLKYGSTRFVADALDGIRNIPERGNTMMKNNEPVSKLIERTIKDLKSFLVFFGLAIVGLLAAKFYIGF